MSTQIEKLVEKLRNLSKSELEARRSDLINAGLPKGIICSLEEDEQIRALGSTVEVAFDGEWDGKFHLSDLTIAKISKILNI